MTDAQDYEAARRAEMRAILAQAKGRARAAQPPAPEKEGDGVLGAIGRGIADVGRGIIEAPEQAWGGAMDAFAEVDQFLESVVPLSEIIGTVDVGEAPEDGERDNIFEWLSSDPASSATGGAIRGASQFLTGFIPALRGLRAAGMAGKGIAATAGQGAAAGAITDFMAFDPHQERLSGLLNEIPALQGPVTEWMAENDPTRETALEGRIKNTIEGAGLGAAAEVMFAGLRAGRSAWKAQRDGRQADPKVIETMAQERPMPEPLTDDAIADIGSRDPDAPLVDFETREDTDLRLAQAAAGATPEWAPMDGRVKINFARMEAPEQLQETIDQLANMNAERIAEARRGNKRGFSQTERDAAALDARQVMEDVIGRPVGTALNAEQMLAARQVHVSMGAQLQELAMRASSEGGTSADMLMAHRALAVYDAFEQSMIGARTEVARSLSAMRIPVGPDAAKGLAVQRMIKDLGGIEDARARLAAIASQTTEEGLSRAAEQTAKESLGKRARKAGFEFYVNGLLSSPKTHAVNITSNAMVSLWSLPERALSARISRGLYGEEAVLAGEASAAAYGMMRGAREGMRLAWETSRLLDAPGGSSRLADMAQQFNNTKKVEGIDRGSVGSPRELAELAASFPGVTEEIWAADKILNAFGMFTRGPSNMLQREDMFFKGVAYRQELSARAFRQAKGEGLEGPELAERMHQIMADPPSDLHMHAINDAHYKTFTAPLGDIGESFMHTVQKVPGARFILPFIKTPTNIMKYTLARTPLALAHRGIRQKIAAGGGEGAEAMARISMGTTALLIAAESAVEGNVSGGGSLNNRVKATERRIRPPYSIKVGDQWVAYNRLDPIGMFLGLGADIAEIMGSDDDDDVAQLVASGATALASNLLSKTYMMGMQEFIAALDPANPTSNMGKWALDQSSGIMPYNAFLRNVAAVEDPILRDPSVQPDQGALAEFWEGAVNRIKRGIPGSSDTLPPRRDMWGEPINRASPYGMAWDFLSPMITRENSQDKVDRAILDNGIPVSPVYRRVMGVKLNPHEYDTYSRIAGELAKGELDKLVGSPVFEKMGPGPEGGKARIINKVMSRARQAAQRQTMQAHPELKARIERSRMEAFGKLTGDAQ